MFLLLLPPALLLGLVLNGTGPLNDSFLAGDAPNELMAANGTGAMPPANGSWEHEGGGAEFVDVDDYLDETGGNDSVGNGAEFVDVGEYLNGTETNESGECTAGLANAAEHPNETGEAEPYAPENATARANATSPDGREFPEADEHLNATQNGTGAEGFIGVDEYLNATQNETGNQTGDEFIDVDEYLNSTLQNATGNASELEGAGGCPNLTGQNGSACGMPANFSGLLRVLGPGVEYNFSIAFAGAEGMLAAESAYGKAPAEIPDGRYDVIVAPLAAEGGPKGRAKPVPIEQISLRGLKVNGSYAGELRIANVAPDATPFGKAAKQAYAIDPAGLDFTGAEAAVRAVGTELYKCAEWDFDAGECSGKWIKQRDITPGEVYAIAFNSTDPAWAEYNATYGAPQCGNWSSPCIANSSLLRSVDNAGGTAEPNQPNTIDGCTDGTFGTYQVDESVENITITSLNGPIFNGGDTVNVSAWVYCWNTGANDNINFVYSSSASSPSWTIVGFTDPCPGGGFQQVSQTFVLDDVYGEHVVRVINQYNGVTTATCGAGAYDDNDDVVFFVNATKPTVNLVYPPEGGFDCSSVNPFVFNSTESSSCTLYIDGVQDQGPISVVEDANYQFNASVLSGSHNWSVICGSVESEVRNFSACIENVVYEDTFTSAGGLGPDAVNTAPWQRGDATQVGGCHRDAYCWGTGLAANYNANGPYDDYLTKTASMNLSNYENITFVFYHYRYFEDATTIYDAGVIEVNNGSGWARLTPDQGYTGTVDNGYGSSLGNQLAYGNHGTGWELQTANLSNYSYQENVTIRYYFAADNSVNDRGWFVDDVKITGDPNVSYRVTAWDDSDAKTVEVGETNYFYANYTYLNGTPITNGAGVCNITTNETYSMDYNSTLGLYVHAQAFPAAVDSTFFVTCAKDGSFIPVQDSDRYVITADELTNLTCWEIPDPISAPYPNTWSRSYLYCNYSYASNGSAVEGAACNWTDNNTVSYYFYGSEDFNLREHAFHNEIQRAYSFGGIWYDLQSIRGWGKVTCYNETQGNMSVDFCLNYMNTSAGADNSNVNQSNESQNCFFLGQMSCGQFAGMPGNTEGQFSWVYMDVNMSQYAQTRAAIGYPFIIDMQFTYWCPDCNFSLFTTPYNESQYSANLIALYHLDNYTYNGSDYLAADATGRNNLTRYGTVGISPGQVDNCTNFSNDHGYLAIADNDEFDIQTDIFIEAYIKVDQHVPRERAIISKYGYESVDFCGPGMDEPCINQRGYRIYLDKENRLTVALSSHGTKSSEFEVRDDMPFPEGEWVHVAFFYDGNIIKLYRNGVVVSKSDGFSGRKIFNSNAPFVIGSEEGNLFGEYVLVDEARVLNKSLTDPEVVSHMNADFWLINAQARPGSGNGYVSDEISGGKRNFTVISPELGEDFVRLEILGNATSMPFNSTTDTYNSRRGIRYGFETGTYGINYTCSGSGAESQDYSSPWTVEAGAPNCSVDDFLASVELGGYQYVNWSYNSNVPPVRLYLNMTHEDGAVYSDYIIHTENASAFINHATGIGNITCYIENENSSYSQTRQFNITPPTECFYASSEDTVYALGSDLAGNKGDKACITVDAMNVVIDCNGHSITGNGSDSTYGLLLGGIKSAEIRNCGIYNYSYGIYGAGNSTASIYNNTIENISISGIYTSGVYTAKGAYGTNISNNSIRLSGSGIMLENAYGVKTGRNTISGCGYGIEISGGGSHLSDSDAITGANYSGIFINGSSSVKITNAASNSNTGSGIIVLDSDDADIDPSYFCGNTIGINVSGSNGTVINDSVACNNSLYGIYIYNSNNTLITNSSTHSNSIDFAVNNTLGMPALLDMDSLIFDRPEGDRSYYTNLSISDYVSASSAYSINWTPSLGVPPGKISFRGKNINITALGGTVSIDRINWHWTVPELEGYIESELELWRYNSSWALMNDSPDTSLHTLGLSNLNPASDYGIFGNSNSTTNLTCWEMPNRVKVGDYQMYFCNYTNSTGSPINSDGTCTYADSIPIPVYYYGNDAVDTDVTIAGPRQHLYSFDNVYSGMQTIKGYGKMKCYPGTSNNITVDFCLNYLNTSAGADNSNLNLTNESTYCIFLGQTSCSDADAYFGVQDDFEWMRMDVNITAYNNLLASLGNPFIVNMQFAYSCPDCNFTIRKTPYGPGQYSANLVALYHLDNFTDIWGTNYTIDESANGLNMSEFVDDVNSTRNVTVSPGWINNSMNFTGTNASLRAADDGSGVLDTPDNLTVEALVYQPADTGTLRVFISKFGATGANCGPAFSGTCTNQRSWAMAITAGNQLAFYLNNDGTAGGGYTIVSLDSVPVGEWVHVAGTFDGEYMKLYMDGDLQASGTGMNGSTIYNGTAPLVIGANDAGIGNLFDGSVDEVRILDRALTGEEIVENVNQDVWKIAKDIDADYTANYVSLNSSAGKRNWSAVTTEGQDLVRLEAKGYPVNMSYNSTTGLYSSGRPIAYGFRSGTYYMNYSCSKPGYANNTINESEWEIYVEAPSCSIDDYLDPVNFGDTQWVNWSYSSGEAPLSKYLNITHSDGYRYVDYETNVENVTADMDYDFGIVSITCYVENANGSNTSTVDYTVPYTCGNLIKNATLVNDVYSNGTCFQMGVDNLVLDCGGYRIMGNATGFGVYTYGANNITLKHCNISNFTDAVGLNNVDNSTFYNNSVHDSSARGFEILAGSDNNNFTQNFAYDNAAQGFYSAGSSGNLFYNNTAYMNSQGFYMNSGSDNNRMISCSAYSAGSSVAGFRIRLSGNNSIIDALSHDNLRGVRVQDSGSTTIRSMVTYNNSDSGIRIDSGSTFTNVANVTTYDNDVAGFYILESSDGVNIANSSSYGNAYGIRLSDTNNTNYENIMLYNNGYDFHVSNLLAGNIVCNATNMTFANPSGTLENYTVLDIYDAVSPSSYFINWTSNSSALPPLHSSFNQKFVEIANLSGLVAVDAITWHWLDSEVAGHDESRLSLWKHNASGWTVLNSTPDIAANTLGLRNMNPASDYTILGNETSVCGIINSSGSYSLNADLEGAPINASPLADSACIKIAASDVVLDCGGYNITDNGTAGMTYGVLLNGSLTNVTVKNCGRIADYVFGVYVYESNYTNIANNTLTNITFDAIMLLSSHFSTITGNYMHDNTARGLRIWGSSYNNVSDNMAASCFPGYQLFHNSSYNIYRNNSVTNSTNYGFRIYNQSMHNSFINNNACNITEFMGAGGYGFYLHVNASRNNFTGNTVCGNTNGFFVNESSDSFISSNNISNNTGYGIAHYDSDYTTIYNNTMDWNMGDTITGRDSDYVNISYNSLLNGDDDAIFNYVSFGSYIAYNNIGEGVTTGMLDAFANDGIDMPNNTMARVIGNNISMVDLGVRCDYCRNVTIEDNIMDDAILGVGSADIAYSNMSNNRIYNMTYGFYLIGSSKNLRLVNNTVYNNTYGLYLNPVSDSIFENNSVYNNTNTGIHLSGPANNFSYNNVSNNSQHGFAVISANFNAFVNNTVYGNIQNGFYLSSSNRSTLADNIAYGNGDGFFLQYSNNNNLTNNTGYANLYGFYLSGSSDNNFIDNTARDNLQHGFNIIASSDYNNLTDNTAYNNIQYGLYIDRANRTNVTNMHFYGNNLGDFYVATDAAARPVYLYNMTIDNPLGGFQNYTSLSIEDSIEANTAYSINWTANSSGLPTGRISFREKWVNITNRSGAVSIDSITWHWLDSELPGYDETEFELWRWNGSWAMLNSTPNIAANELSLTNMNPASDYGILQGGLDNCPVISSPGTYLQPQNYVGAPNDAAPLSPDPVNYTCVKITVSNVVFDCNGYNITDNGTASVGSAGVLLNGSLTNVTVRNCPGISNYTLGIGVFASNGSMLYNNTARNNSMGFGIAQGHGNNFTNNTASGNAQFGFIVVQGSSGNYLGGNRVSGNQFGFAVTEGSASNTFADNVAYGNPTVGFYSSSSNGTTLRNNSISGSYFGCYFELSSGNMITNNSVSGNTGSGIYLFNRSSGNSLTNNSLHGNGAAGLQIGEDCALNNFTGNGAYNNSLFGFFLQANASGNRFTGNQAYNNSLNGFLLQDSHGNVLEDNTAYRNNYGFRLGANATHNALANNIAFNCSQDGFALFSKSNWNNLTNNSAYNVQNGFYVDSSHNNTLALNTAHNTSSPGFTLAASDFNNLTANTEYGSPASPGFVLVLSDYNILWGNSARDNPAPGFFINTSSGNALGNNSAYNNSYFGIYLIYSDNNSMGGDLAHNNSIDGLHLDNSDYNNISGLLAYNNSDSGVYLSNSYNNTIMDSFSHNNSQSGFYIDNSPDNDFINVSAYNNSVDGFTGDYSSNLFIDPSNFKNNNGNGVNLNNCHDAVFENINASGNNGHGLHIVQSDRVNITGSTFCYNHQYGIRLHHTEYIYINDSDMCGNDGHGVQFDDAQNTTLNLSRVSGNSDHGLYLSDSDDSIFVFSNITNNTIGGIRFSADSGGAGLYSNQVCFNGFDVDNLGPSNAGAQDSCDSWSSWSESGHGGCTYRCTEIWHYFYGDVNGSLLLAPNSVDIFYSWLWNGNEGNVYVINGDANVQWINLTALGRTDAGAPSNNDFVELDTLLGYSAEPDNINITYSTDGSTPKRTENMTLFRHFVPWVPEANSTTQNSTFDTGITWDASQGWPQFNTTANQDVAFITAVNTSAPYDYEIRVPANLSTYKGVSGVVEFWVELD